MNKPILAALPLALLAACSSGGETADADADGDGTVSQEEATEEMQSANIQLVPGTWEATVQLTEFDMPQMPPEARDMMQQQMGRTQTSTSCITPEQAANPEAEFFANQDDNDCSYSEFDMSGGNILIAASCQPEGMGGAMNMRMEGSYSPSEYDMTMTMDTDTGPAGPMRIAGRVTGRHVADECGADSGE